MPTRRATGSNSNTIQRIAWPLGPLIRTSRLRMLRLRLRKLARLAGNADYWTALRYGVLAATEHADSGLPTQAATVFDIGASRGQFALFARRRWPAARIVCFEPIAEAGAKLRRVLGDSVSLHVTALGAEAGTGVLNISQEDDSSSLLPSGRQLAEFPNTGTVGTTPVRIDTLKSYLTHDLQRPVVVKIDVQGFELEVLRGAGDSLQYVDELLCECSFVELYSGQPCVSEIVSFLQTYGFQLTRVSGITTADSGEQLQADFLFSRRSGDSGSG